MASKSLGDLTIKVGSYTASDGKEKGEYRNLGVLMQSDDGGYFVLLNADILPESRVLCGVFAPREGDGAGSPAKAAPAASGDEIPF